MTDDGKPECLVLKPRFLNATSFDGYDQISGNVVLDSYGHLYGVVRIEDYNLLKARIEKLERALNDLKHHRDSPAYIRVWAHEALKA